MRKLLRLSIAALACALALSEGPARAAGSSALIQGLEKSVQSRIEPLLRKRDPHSLVIVRIVPAQNSSQALPGTPYVVRNIIIENDQGQVTIRKVALTVFNSEGQLSDAARSFLERLVPAALGDGTAQKLPVEITVEKIPDELFPTQTQDETAKAIADGFTGLRGFLGGFQRAIIAFFFALGVLCLGGALLMFRIVIMGEGASLRQSIDRVATGMESGGPATPPSIDRESASERPRQSASRGGEPARTSELAEYPVEVLLECLWDCYWCQEDGYAAYLWKRIDVAKRRQILSNSSHWAAYAAYLHGVEEVDLDRIDDSAYLNPLGLSHLDQRALTALVRENPGLYHRLSGLRREGLELRASEKIHLSPAPASFTAKATAPWGKAPASALRALKTADPIPIHTIEEERELLSLGELSREQMAAVPSLVWATRVPETDLREVLAAFSARELALAWIGPQEVLDTLARALPEKKRELVNSLLKQASPRRASAEFQKLHRTIVDRLEESGPRHERQAA